VAFVADGLLVHSDAGSQDTSPAFSQKHHDHGLVGSIGRVGTAYDNALMQSTIGLFKTELIHARATGWQSRQEVETATARWVAWFNRVQLRSESPMLGAFDDVPRVARRRCRVRRRFFERPPAPRWFPIHTC